MKKRFLLLITMIILVLSFGGCSKASKDMTAEDYAKKLKDSGLSIDNLIVYDEETDENKLLGRPNQYTSKVNFDNGSIEVFENETDAKNRQDYINKIGESASLFSEYNYLKDNVLLRINHEVTPEEAEKYEKEFQKIK